MANTSSIRNKYRRTNFLTPFDNAGVEELDLSSTHFGMFVPKSKVRLYQIDDFEEFRPDIICNNIYRNTHYWWILLKFNDIIDHFTELKQGLIIKVPTESDIKAWQKQVVKQMSKEKLHRESK